MKIAISGKGGVGKTTVCAILAELFGRDGLDVLALDADSDSNLAAALGIKPENCPQPLIEMKDLIKERTGAEPGALGQYFKLNPKVSDLPDEYSYKAKGIKLLVLGGIEIAGAGCACPESAFLKALLTHTILQRREMVLVDMPAGVEFMGRACVQGIDALLVVIEPGSRSIATALNIAHMAREMRIPKVAAFVNKVTNDAQIDEIKSQIPDITILGSFRYDPSLQMADLRRTAAIDASQELVTELLNAKKNLTELLSAPS